MARSPLLVALAGSVFLNLIATGICVGGSLGQPHWGTQKEIQSINQGLRTAAEKSNIEVEAFKRKSAEDTKRLDAEAQLRVAQEEIQQKEDSEALAWLAKRQEEARIKHEQELEEARVKHQQELEEARIKREREHELRQEAERREQQIKESERKQVVAVVSLIVLSMVIAAVVFFLKRPREMRERFGRLVHVLYSWGRIPKGYGLHKSLAGVIGGLVVAALAMILMTVTLAAAGPSPKALAVSFWILWGCGFYVALRSPSPESAWRALLLSSSILSFLLPISGMLYTGGFLATKVVEVSEAAGANAAGAYAVGGVIAGGIITTMLGFTGFFLGVAFLVPGLLIGRNGKDVLSTAFQGGIEELPILETSNKAAACPDCGNTVPVNQPQCNHCLNNITWINGKALRPSRSVPGL